MFKSKQQMVLEGDQLESWARTCVYELLINTNLKTSQIKELFINAFPEYEYVLDEILENEGIECV